ncbi:sugar phosphate isomerase/epimerase family protein [Stackebrandtia nassauensis]|uniref:Xylose isomerase domain protein TIM barrel n=1 Tax=Stackebrandtia nassauensis (strain DSM 44728 / CIP 108903 / NRRL B-16338 / NBRC 102104 / LLR-40K-21) TaxID=446470 RepID=D3Q6Q2_STANL|nr:sugar phosphate isomerase/epimerase family protein [Stackebrandtia nassauensis]ADD44295.1 Xylose isomerase domain protein TIM barrel [Stackebrandtia nassauensis DSM 44728]
MNHPVGVNTWVWTSPLTDAALAELAPRIRDWGFDAVELPVENPGDFDPGRAAELLSELDLKPSVVLVMGPGRELVAAPDPVIESTQAYLRHVADVAARVGSPVIAGPAYTSVGRTWRLSDAERRDCYALLRDNLRPVLDHAARRGVRLAVEPLNRYETSLLNTVEQTLDALAGLPEDQCGIALDVYHQNIEERDIPAAIRAASGRIAHVQVCGNDRGAPGADHLDWPGILAALADSGYTGPLIIESFTADNATIATAASIWRPLATTQDDLAREGLAFLRAAQTEQKDVT